MISNFIIPILVLFIIIYAVIKKVDVYDTFIEGAKESFGINLFGFISFIPNEVIPMILTRPISGTTSLAVLTNIYKSLGPDGYIGTLASFIQGSTDTTFYVITLYFGSIGIKKIKYALWAGLFADLLAIILSIICVNIIF